MPARGPELDPSTPLGAFATAMQDLLVDAGNPKQQQLASKLSCARATVSAIVNGHRFPSWDWTKKFVQACGGDVDEWKTRWMETQRRIKADNKAAPEESIALPHHAELQPAWYLNNEQFYSNVADRVRVTRERIMVTYIRRRPPDYYTSDAAAEYFSTVLEWARQPGARSVRRIICIPNPEMLAWAHRHYEETKEIRNYDARVIPWKINADGINMALLDHSTVFLAFSGEASQELSGFRVESPEFLNYFAGHFDQFWASGVDLSVYLRQADADKTP